MSYVLEKERDPFFREGIEKGIEKGRQEGYMKLLEEKRAIAYSLLEVLDDKTIAEKVGLPLEEIKKLRK